MATATTRTNFRWCSGAAAAGALMRDSTSNIRRTLRSPTCSCRCWMHSARRWSDSPTAPVRCLVCWLSMRRLPVVTISLVVSVLILQAADISGIWFGSVTGGRRNQVQDFAFQFIQKGTTLTGKLYVDYGSTPILKGTIDGDQIAFQVVARE